MMKTSFRAASIAFTLGVVASGGTLLWLLGHSTNIIKCRTGNLAASVAPEDVKSLEYGWIQSARQCDIGEYLVVTPVKNDQKAILVLRNGNVTPVVFAANADATNVFDPDGKRGLRGLLVRSGRDKTTVFNVGGKGELLTVEGDSITLADRDVKRVLVSIDHPQSGPNLLRYSTYDPSQAAWIENVIGPDGNLTLRRTEVPGHAVKTEFPVGQRWLERVERDGDVGTVLDGQFMSVADARAKLGVKPKYPPPK